MRIFCDSEFDVPTGTLISLALISEDGEKVFYEVLDHSNVQDEWVKENVIPILQKEPISWEEFQNKLEVYLKSFAGVNLIVNHPSDVVYFSKAIMKEKGKWILIQPLTFDIDDKISGRKSKVHHNALYDTMAQREDWLKQNGYS